MFKIFALACSNDLRASADYMNGLDLSQYSPEGQKLLKEAIQINQCVATDNHVRFFKLLTRTNYMFACLMLNFINIIRLKTLNCFQKVW